jgi:hypothetical protein
LTSASPASPIVFMARAQAPMFPGWLVLHRTTRTRDSGASAGGDGEESVTQAQAEQRK